MFLFSRLVLAHFIADFPLQFSKLYYQKLAGIKGNLFHGLIVFICMAVLGFPFAGSLRFWFFIAGQALAHSALDYWKVTYVDPKTVFKYWRAFILDQLLHIALISLVLLTPLAEEMPVLPANMLFALYSNDYFIYLALGYVISCWAGGVFIHLLHRSLKVTFRDERFAALEKNYAVFERGIITTCAMLSGYFLFLILTVPLLRVFFMRHKYLKGSLAKKAVVLDVIISVLWAVLIGFLLRAAGVGSYVFG